MDDARERKNPRKISGSYSKAANQTNMLSQLSSAWYNLDVDFRRDIPEPSETTHGQYFLASNRRTSRYLVWVSGTLTSREKKDSYDRSDRSQRPHRAYANNQSPENAYT